MQKNKSKIESTVENGDKAPKPLEKPLYPDFPKMVKALLAKRGKSMGDLAAYLDMTRQGLYKHLKAFKPHFHIVLLLAEYFDTTVDEVLGDSKASERYNRPYTAPVFFNFKNRVLLIAGKQNISVSDLCKNLNMNKDSLIEQLENIENGAINMLKDDDAIFVDRLLRILSQDFEKFFFLKPGTVSEFEQEREKIIQKSNQASLEYSVEDLFDVFQQNINDRMHLLKSIAGYYIENYPNDILSKELNKIYSKLDSFGSDTEEFREIESVIWENRKKKADKNQ